jgi:hypothetical protein
MVSQADVARATKEKTTGEVVEAVSRRPHGPRIAKGDGDTGTQEQRSRDSELQEQRSRNE